MSEEKKILIIQTAFPGDAILTLPFIQELKKNRPGYSIDILCIPATEVIFNASPNVNSVMVLDKKGKHKPVFAFINFLKELKGKKYYCVYSPHRSFRSAIITLSLSAEESYGFDNSSLKFAYKYLVKYDPLAHEVKRNLNFIGTDFNGEKWRILPEINVPQKSKIQVSDYFTERKINKFLAIAPGSVWATKRYPVEYFRQVIEYFSREKFQVILIGGPEDKLLCEELQKNYEKDVHITAGYFSFIDTIELRKSVV